ncbi:MAG: DUF4928 family protein [Verrucomicrobiales bacterium]|nr:DUF4928 family protein [Verrucomicrobiales bacterium]
MLLQKLRNFASKHDFLSGKGSLCVALVVTRIAVEKGLPLDPDSLLTKAKGQVRGLGRSGVQKILKDYGITKTLAAEGGRTSRGSIENMQEYVKFLNQIEDFADLNIVESWWIERVRDYFNASPLKLKVDSGTSLRSCVRSVFTEAVKRQSESHGSTIVGAVMQHLVGAKLSVLYPDNEIENNGYSVADAPTNRPGDFLIGDCSIHVTTAPSPALIEKCQNNINQGLSPLVISSKEGAGMAENLASNHGLEKRIDVLDIEQFLVANLFEWTGFQGQARKESFQNLISKYNQIVSECETNPSLQIMLS